MKLTSSISKIEKSGDYNTLILLWLIHVESGSRSVVSNSLPPHGLYSPWNSPGQNTVVGSLFVLQGIFPN